MTRRPGRPARVAGLAIALALTLAGLAAAESPLDAIRARGVIRVGVKTDAPPFGFLDGRGRPAGFEVDLARFFARVLFDDDAGAQLVPVTTTTRFVELQAGRVDLLIATVTATEERRRLMELSEPYFMSASLLLVSQRSPLRGLGDAADRKVAVVRGSVHERDVAEIEPRAIRMAVASVAEGLRAVKGGQADALVYDDVVVLDLARKDPALRVVGDPIRPRPYAMAARREDAALVRWVNGWLAKMRRDGSYVTLWRRHFTPFEHRLVGG